MEWGLCDMQSAYWVGQRYPAHALLPTTFKKQLKGRKITPSPGVSGYARQQTTALRRCRPRSGLAGLRAYYPDLAQSKRGEWAMSYRWWSSCRTTRGRRRSINEDAYLNLEEVGLWVVADGMGGHARGEVASRIVIDALNDLTKPQSIDEFALAVRSRLSWANAVIRDEVQRAGFVQGMGSTVVVLMVHQREWCCLWAGDSRAYLMRDGQLSQISRDHSLVQELIDQGRLQPDEAAVHPAANRITRAIGVQRELVLDEFSSVLRDGDTFLLCSDGLNKEVTDHELATILDNYDCEEASRELVELTLERGARDNVTVAVIQFEATTGFSEYKPDDTAINYGFADGLVRSRPSLALSFGSARGTRSHSIRSRPLW